MADFNGAQAGSIAKAGEAANSCGTASSAAGIPAIEQTLSITDSPDVSKRKVCATWLTLINGTARIKRQALSRFSEVGKLEEHGAGTFETGLG